jgi:hypothetical protein
LHGSSSSQSAGDVHDFGSVVVVGTGAVVVELDEDVEPAPSTTSGVLVVDVVCGVLDVDVLDDELLVVGAAVLRSSWCSGRRAAAWSTTRC